MNCTNGSDTSRAWLDIRSGHSRAITGFGKDRNNLSMDSVYQAHHPDI